MGILRKMGLKIRGDFCFYAIRPNTAVVVGMRMKNRQWGRIPKRIGHYIVRGIQMLERSPNYLTALETLTEPQKESLKKKLAPYVSVHTYPLDLLPQTVEFVGNYECADEALLQVPEHIRYMDKLAVSGKNLSLPNGLLYLGQVRQGRREVLRNIYVHGNPNPEKPALPISAYLPGVEDVPQWAANALTDCGYLTSVSLGSQLQRIGKRAFPYNPVSDLLCDIAWLPPTLQEVGEDALSQCRVGRVYYPDGLHPALRSQKLVLGAIDTLVIREMEGLEEYLKLVKRGTAPDNHPGACLYHLLRLAKKVEIHSEMTAIPAGMFRDCVHLTTLSFHNAPGSERIAFPDSVTTIGEGAFCNCRSITEVYFPRRMSRVEMDAFYGCRNLKAVHTNMVLQYIGDRAFAETAISRFRVPALVTAIGGEAFRGCRNLRQVELPKNLEELGVEAFTGCESLELPPQNRSQLEQFIGYLSYRQIYEARTVKVEQLLQQGDGYLAIRPQTSEAKKQAFEAYLSAMKLDHYREEILQRMIAMLLDYQIPLRLSPAKEQELLDTMDAYGRSEYREKWSAACQKVKDAAEEICGKDLDSAVRAYCIGRNPKAVVVICDHLARMLEARPKISVFAKDTVYTIMETVLYGCTDYSLRDSLSRHNDSVRIWSSKRTPISGWQVMPVEERDVVSMLSCESFRKLYRLTVDLYEKGVSPNTLLRAYTIADVMLQKDPEIAYYDAQFWLELVHQFAAGRTDPAAHEVVRKKRKKATILP